MSGRDAWRIHAEPAVDSGWLQAQAT